MYFFPKNPSFWKRPHSSTQKYIFRNGEECRQSKKYPPFSKRPHSCPFFENKSKRPHSCPFLEKKSKRPHSCTFLTCVSFSKKNRKGPTHVRSSLVSVFRKKIEKSSFLYVFPKKNSIFSKRPHSCTFFEMNTLFFEKAPLMYL